jgi:alpha-tubulin suppressor-like RCC1 family protein
VWTGGGNITDFVSFKPATFNNSISYPRIVSIAAGIDHSLAVDGDGKLWATGDNLDGQLGLGNYISQNLFQLVTISGLAPAKIVSIAAGSKHSLVLDSDGRVWTSGDSNFGQLGLRIARTYEFKLVTISGLPSGTKIVSIAANGEYSLALDSDGKIWATGANYFTALRRGGQLGLGDWDDSCFEFTQVPLFDLH